MRLSAATGVYTDLDVSGAGELEATEPAPRYRSPAVMADMRRPSRARDNGEHGDSDETRDPEQHHRSKHDTDTAWMEARPT